jgi:NitT/TauT family transport system substrate-binding protein
MRLVALVSLVSSLAALMAGCARHDGAGAHVRIAIGGQSQMIYLPTTLAQELGYYREEGLDVELEDFAGGAKALQSLVGGSADVVSGFYDHDSDGRRGARARGVRDDAAIPGWCSPPRRRAPRR